MVRAHSKYSAFILVLFFLSGCVKTVDLTTGERKVVVECILSEESQQTMLLSLTNGVTGIGPEALDRAVATLIDLTAGSTVGQFVLGEDGVWTLDYVAIPEHSYRLEIDVPGYGTVRAEDTMPSKVNVSFFLSPPKNGDSTYFYHCVHIPADIQSGQSAKDYYVPVRQVFFRTESLPDQTLIEGLVFSGEKDVYNRCKMLCTDCTGLVGTNISGGVYESKIVVRKEGLYKINPLLDGASLYIGYLRIDKAKSIEQEYFSVAGNDFQDYILSNYLKFYSLSDNYSAFIDGGFSKHKDNSDLAALFGRESSFSNIEGGVGIFASATSEILPIVIKETLWEVYGNILIVKS